LAEVESSFAFIVGLNVIVLVALPIFAAMYEGVTFQPLMHVAFFYISVLIMAFLSIRKIQLSRKYTIQKVEDYLLQLQANSKLVKPSEDTSQLTFISEISKKVDDPEPTWKLRIVTPGAAVDWSDWTNSLFWRVWTPEK
jgi:hypothetical protein